MYRLSEKRGIPVFHLGSLVNWMLSRDLAVRGETQWEAIPWIIRVSVVRPLPISL